ncbi:MAG: hypothetical protein ACPG5B_02680 [Chitinophagales bacterium]
MKNLSFFCFLSLLIFFSACSEKQVVESELSGLNLRVINLSSQTFDNVRISNFDFGTVQAYETTEYMQLESLGLIDGIPHVIGMADDEEFGIMGFCGNSIFSEITEGLYTLKIGFDRAGSMPFHLQDDNQE